MSQFKTQRIANQYPLWTKTRFDPSSLAQRLFSSFAEYLDFVEAETFRLKDENFLLKWHVGIGSLWSIWLDPDDYITTTPAVGGGLVVDYPSSVIAEHSTLGSITLERDSDFQDMLYAGPTRLALEETETIVSKVIWNSSSLNTFNDFTYPERLTINVQNSTLYNKKTAIADRLHSGFNGITIHGLDINRIPFSETIPIRDDGVYTTRNFWSKIDTTPEVDGFNGDITIGYKQSSLPYVLDPYRTVVLDDIEGPLKLRLEIDDSNRTFLVYFTDRLKLGSDYRRGTVEVENEVILGKQELLDNNALEFEAVDLVVSYENTKLYVIDTTGVLHVFDHGLNAFNPPQENTATRSSRISLIPLQPYVKLGDIHPVATHHRRPKNPIIHAIIKRIKPDSTVEYLQSNYTWAGSVHKFLGEPLAKTAVASWQDFRFDIEYDQLGQWDLYIEVQSGTENTIYHTAVMVDSLSAEVSIATGVIDPIDLFFSKEGYVTVSDTISFYKFSEHRDTYFVDAERQQIVFREDYTSVEVNQ